jgi:hypothetical protein
MDEQLDASLTLASADQGAPLILSRTAVVLFRLMDR